MSKLITVFGATGNQGGSVIKAILADSTLSSEFKIRAVTRDVTKPAAKALASKGVEVVSGDLSTAETIAPAVQGAHTVFLATNFWESASKDTEVAQGKAAADAAKAAGVQHLIFSSLLHTGEITQGRLPHITHFEGKAEVEKYIRDSGVPATFVLPGMFMSSFFDMINKGEDGTYMLALPIPGDKAVMPLIDAAGDTGKWVRVAIQKYPEFVGKRIYAANDYVTPDQVAATFAEGTGQPARFQQIPEDVFKSFLPPFMAQEMLENIKLLVDVGYYGGADLKEHLDLIGEKPTSWKEYVEANKASKV